MVVAEMNAQAHGGCPVYGQGQSHKDPLNPYWLNLGDLPSASKIGFQVKASGIWRELGVLL